MSKNTNPATAGYVPINAKDRNENERQVRRAKKKKGIEEQRAKPPTPTRATNALIGDEEQNGKEKKETGSVPPSKLP